MANFMIAFIFSFIGSIPPGAINITVIQYTLEKKIKAALRFSAASALVEFPYVIIAIYFSEMLLSSDTIMNNIKLISVLVMFSLAFLNTYGYLNPSHSVGNSNSMGFRKGLVISIFNPMAIPFWIGVTAYLMDQKWVKIETTNEILCYAFGVSIGTFLLLSSLIAATYKFNFRLQNQRLSKLIPAIVFYILGFYGLSQLI